MNNGITAGKKAVEDTLEERKLIAVVKHNDGNLLIKENPIKYLSEWDFWLLGFAVLFRLLVELSKKNEELDAKGEKFSWGLYWDFRHITRWLMHVFASVIGIIILPEILVDVVQKRYFSEMTEWTLFGSGLIGYLGYDILKVIEAVGLMLLEKINVLKFLFVKKEEPAPATNKTENETENPNFNS